MRQRFETLLPGAFFLDADQPAELTAWLHDKGWLDEEEQVTALRSAGEGNMNLTLRVFTSTRRFILRPSGVSLEAIGWYSP